MVVVAITVVIAVAGDKREVFQRCFSVATLLEPKPCFTISRASARISMIDNVRACQATLFKATATDTVVARASRCRRWVEKLEEGLLAHQLEMQQKLEEELRDASRAFLHGQSALR